MEARRNWSLRYSNSYNEAPGSDGIGGRMAASGKVAMAAGADSEPETVTSAMIAAGISQLPPMDMALDELTELLTNVYRAMRRLRRMY